MLVGEKKSSLEKPSAICLLLDVHSTTTQHNESVGSILVLTLDNSSYIDITLFDICKQEFYTKMNLLGEITFDDHR